VDLKHNDRTLFYVTAVKASSEFIRIFAAPDLKKVRYSSTSRSNEKATQMCGLFSLLRSRDENRRPEDDLVRHVGLELRLYPIQSQRLERRVSEVSQQPLSEAIIHSR